MLRDSCGFQAVSEGKIDISITACAVMTAKNVCKKNCLEKKKSNFPCECLKPLLLGNLRSQLSDMPHECNYGPHQPLSESLAAAAAPVRRPTGYHGVKQI